MDKKRFAFEKSNYTLLLIGVAVIVIGFLLMTGPGSTELTFDEAQDIAILAAREQFGDDAFVVPASEKKALYVNIDNKKRACFMFGAGELNLTDGTITGLYHVDADTGEVFDNSKGNMEKIR